MSDMNVNVSGGNSVNGLGVNVWWTVPSTVLDGIKSSRFWSDTVLSRMNCPCLPEERKSVGLVIHSKTVRASTTGGLLKRLLMMVPMRLTGF